MMKIMSYINQADFDRPSIQIALDLIYISNKERLVEEKVKLGFPKVLDVRPEITDDPNTFIPVTVDELFDMRYATHGSDGFMYRRLPLSIIDRVPGHLINPPHFPFKTSEVLDQINEQLNTQLTMGDLQEREYTKAEGVMNLYAHPHSLVWIGETEMAVNWGQPLVPIVEITYLSGFNEFVA